MIQTLKIDKNGDNPKGIICFDHTEKEVAKVVCDKAIEIKANMLYEQEIKQLIAISENFNLIYNNLK